MLDAMDRDSSKFEVMIAELPLADVLRFAAAKAELNAMRAEGAEKLSEEAQFAPTVRPVN